MPRTGRVLWLLACAACAAAAVQSLAAAPEYNPVRRAPIAIGPEAKRLIVGMRATPDQRRGKNDRRRAPRAQLHRHAGANDARGRESPGAARRLESREEPPIHAEHARAVLAEDALRRRRRSGSRETARRSRGAICRRGPAALPARRPDESLVPAHAGDRQRAVVHEHAGTRHGGGRGDDGRVGDRCRIRVGHHHGQRRGRDCRCRYRHPLRPPRLAAGRSRRPLAPGL